MQYFFQMHTPTPIRKNHPKTMIKKPIVGLKLGGGVPPDVGAAVGAGVV